MKPNIHPDYVETTITCACGTVYHTRSTKQHLRIGICSSCHPYFTGQQKFVDTAGRVEKFTRRFGATSKMVAKAGGAAPAAVAAPAAKSAAAKAPAKKK